MPIGVVSRGVLTAALVATVPAISAAQATSVVTPGVAVGYAYDDNVLWRPAAESDYVLRVSPSLRFTRDDIRSSWIGDFSLNAERFSRSRSLTTMLARQHASVVGNRKLDQASNVGIEAAYDNSVTPTDLNLSTGLGLGRTRAWRWYAGPNASRAVTGRTTLRAAYRLTGDYAETTPDVITHDGLASAQFAVSQRTDITAQYNAQLFAFESADAVLSHVGRLTWRRRAATHARLEFSGGVRFTEGEWRPEIAGKFLRSSIFSDATLEYAWTQTTALGVASLVDVQRVSASVGYHQPGGWSLAANGGAYFNEIGVERATVYHGGADVARTVFGAVSIGLSYSFDYQTDPLHLLPFTSVSRNSILPLPAAFSGRLGGPLRRHFVLARIIVSGSRRSASGPAEPPKDGSEPRTGRRDAN